MSARTIVCLHWGTRYGPHYVNRLYYGIARRLAGKFNFIRCADNDTGIEPAIETRRSQAC
ncbi:MAG: hypothetical protein OXU61_00585 [Gammaproteobacteria bacterium]|nr:hypothetical protein [Gammaproteobacteria bacterium]